VSNLLLRAYNATTDARHYKNSHFRVGCGQRRYAYRDYKATMCCPLHITSSFDTVFDSRNILYNEMCISLMSANMTDVSDVPIFDDGDEEG
jgi:hypothetical protein